MKSFALFIFEKYIDGNRVTELEMMSRYYLPLSPSILNKFERFVPKTYHVTSFAKTENIRKLQGKRKDIATFTRGSAGLAAGAIESAQILFTLEGTSSFKSEADFSSRLDRNGIRWLDAQSQEDKDSVVNNKFSKAIKKVIDKKYGSVDLDSMDNKRKAEYIKFYFDSAKKIINKPFLDSLQKSLAKGINPGAYNNNEILLHNFKIKKAEIILSDMSQKERVEVWLRRKSDIKIDGYISHNEVSKLKV